ncbi:MAG: hypothetical protein HQL21_08010 [Candidatus Omnitrophica bacterium]|nr:hypothetical protein [Candidatus Omnitrophota bacterium]
MDILFSSQGEKSKASLVFLWLAYAVTTAFLMAHHSPWHDEAFVWLIARELSWLDIYREAGAHHAPSLWYYILAIPAKLGLPYWTMQLIHWLGACFAAWIFLFKAPFSTFFKATFIFSFYIAYEHNITARVYMLTLLFMWSACWCYAKRYERPVLYGLIIALLANVSFLGLLVAIFLAMEYLFFRDSALTRIRWCSIVIMFLAILLSVYGLTLNKYASPYFSTIVRSFNWKLLPDMLYFSYLSPKANFYFPHEIKAGLKLIAPWLSVLYAILTLWLLKKWRAYSFFVFLVLSWLVIAGLMVFNYSWPAPRHYSFFMMYTVMFLWLGAVRYRSAKTMIEPFLGILFVVAFSLGILGTVAQGAYDLRVPFSGGKKMADYLIENKLDDKVIVASDIIPATAILPYVPNVFLWDARVLRTVRFLHFDHLSKPIPTTRETLSTVEESFFFPGEIYFICHQPITAKWTQRLQLVFSVRAQNDSLWLYLMKGSEDGPITVGQQLAELVAPDLDAGTVEINPDNEDIRNLIDME